MRLIPAVLLFGSLASIAAAQERPSTVTTHATARANLPNTVADVGLGITAQGRSVAGVQKALADGSQNLLAELRRNGAERLRTEQVSVTPDTTGTGSDPNRILGYTGQMRVSFRVAAEKLGDVLSAATSHGANTVDGETLLPRESEIDAARQSLAAEAVKTALGQARAVAEAAGYRLGPVQQIMVDPGLGLVQRPMPAFSAPRAMAAMAAPVATEAGQSEVAATVSVVVAILPASQP